MAEQYETTGACGHKWMGRHYGPPKDLKKRLAYLGTRLCPACYQAKIKREQAPSEAETRDAFKKNWKKKCVSCGAKPTVGNTDLCGPCCFGEAETAGGNW